MCGYCGKSFSTKDKRKRFCDRSCATSWRNEQRKETYPELYKKMWTSELKKKQSNRLKKHFEEYPIPKRAPRETRSCPNCDTKFTVRKKNKKQFCSQKCSLDYRNKHYNSMHNPETVEKMRQTQKERYDSMTKEEILASNSQCRRIVSGVNTHYLAEWTRNNNGEISKRMKEYCKNNPDKTLNARLRRNQMTSLEKSVLHCLEIYQLPYLWNKYIKIGDTWKFPDFRITGTNILIECNGAYWHNKKETDERTKLFNENGYNVIMLKEKIIKQGTPTILNTLNSYSFFKDMIDTHSYSTLDNMEEINNE